MRENLVSKKYLIIYSILVLIPLIVALIIYPGLPELVAVRNNGIQPSDFEHKKTLFLLPVLNLPLYLLSIFQPYFDKKKMTNVSLKSSEKLMTVLLMIFNIVFFLEVYMILTYS